MFVAKESNSSIRHSLPFNKVPRLFLIHLVFQEIILTHFPVKGVMSDTIIPKKSLEVSVFIKKNIGPHIGQYCQVQEEDTPCNRNHPHTKGSLSTTKHASLKAPKIPT